MCLVLIFAIFINLTFRRRRRRQVASWIHTSPSVRHGCIRCKGAIGQFVNRVIIAVTVLVNNCCIWIEWICVYSITSLWIKSNWTSSVTNGTIWCIDVNTVIAITSVAVTVAVTVVVDVAVITITSVVVVVVVVVVIIMIVIQIAICVVATGCKQVIVATITIIGVNVNFSQVIF